VKMLDNSESCRIAGKMDTK